MFNSWAEIDSLFEGRFLERIAPGAFLRSLAESGDRVRVLLQHGRDPFVGQKPLARLDVLEEDHIGLRYEAELFSEATYVADLLPGLRAGTFGASFAFKVLREEWVDRPEPSSFNPAALPERTLREVALVEFGPVVFPAYPSATAGVRSLTDLFHTHDEEAAAA